MHSAILYGIAALAASANARALSGQSYEKRHVFGTPEGICAPQPLGSGPTTTPDTADAFLANPVYDNGANSAVTPNGWTVAYRDLKAASTTGGYLGVQEITSYDPAYCAAQCCSSWPGCTSFNIYYERNPTLDPGANCPNPASTTRIKCSFWSQSLTPADATNDGQYCSDFHVVIAGSNGYNGGCAAVTTTSATTTASSTTSSSTTASTTASTTTSSSTTASTTASTTSSSSTTRSTTLSTSTTTASATPSSTSCPTGNEISYTAANGSKWAICKGADYQGNTYQDVHNIQSNTACAEACSVNSGCVKSVFNAAGSVCYLKNGSFNWVANPKYDTCRQTAPAPAPAPAPVNNQPWNTWKPAPAPKPKTCFLWICW